MKKDSSGKPTGKNTHMLDFGLLPAIDSAHTFCTLDSAILKGLSRFSETRRRAESAASFLGAQPAGRWSSEPDDEDAKRKDEAFIRASLAELVSMEDTLARDLKRNGLAAQRWRMYSCPNPLLHILRELRNMEVHIRTSTVSCFPIRVLYGQDRTPGRFTVTHLEPISLDDFMQLNNANNYRKEDVCRLLDWFEKSQRVFGIRELILRGIEAYASFIAETFNKDGPTTRCSPTTCPRRAS